MAVPKQKSSKARGRKRRTHYKTNASFAVTLCPKCQEPRLSHTACPECGAYKKRFITQKAKEE